MNEGDTRVLRVRDEVTIVEPEWIIVSRLFKVYVIGEYLRGVDVLEEGVSQDEVESGSGTRRQVDRTVDSSEKHGMKGLSRTYR